jgi:hypothetical protein
MTAEFIITGIYRPQSSWEESYHVRNLELNNDTIYEPDQYINEAENTLNIEEAPAVLPDLEASVIDPVISFFSERIVSPDPVTSPAIEQVFANATTMPIPSANQTIDSLASALPFQNFSVPVPSLSTFLSPGGAPDGDPGGVPPDFTDNITFTSPLKKLSIQAFSSAAELAEGTDWAKGFSYALLGVAALASTYFLGRAVYRGYQRQQSLSASRSASQRREQFLQQLINRQALIDKQALKERFRRNL